MNDHEIHDKVISRWRVYDIAYVEFEGHDKEKREHINQEVIPTGAIFDAIKFSRIEERQEIIADLEKYMKTLITNKDRLSGMQQAIDHLKEVKQ